MTARNARVTASQRFVVFIDIISSTAIVEDLVATENFKIWRNHLISLKELLISSSAKLDFEVYKFLGDGWIILSSPGASDARGLLACLQNFSERHHNDFIDNVKRFLSQETGVRVQLKPGSECPQNPGQSAINI